jgi:hypothetical protein
VAFAQNADLALVLGDEWGDGQFPSFSLGNGYDMGQGAWYLSATSFWPVAGFKLSQFDGAGAASTASSDDDGNRLTDRWQASIPWTSLGPPTGLTALRTCGCTDSSSATEPTETTAIFPATIWANPPPRPHPAIMGLRL